MKKAALLFNPLAGHGSHSRQQIVEQAAGVLRRCGVETLLIATRGAGTATEQTREALGNGCDTVFACGGDGTVHEVLQAMAGGESSAAMAILPLGTGNVLANEIGIPGDPAAAVAFALAAIPQRLPCGLIRYTDKRGESQSRYFTVAAGVGSHATMIYQSTAERKNQHGMLAYYKTGFTLLFREPFVPFSAEIVTTQGETLRMPLLDVLTVRVVSFGGLLKRWRPGGSLHHTHLHLLLNRGAKRGDLFRYVISAILGQRWMPKGLEFISSERIVCTPIGQGDSRVHVEADGEALGGMPVEISMVPDAFTLLLPRNPASS